MLLNLIYYDLFLEINKSIWKTLETFLNLPYLGCLEVWVIICQTSGCQAVINFFPSHKIIFIWFKVTGEKSQISKPKYHPVLLQHSQKTLSLEKKNYFF